MQPEGPELEIIRERHQSTIASLATKVGRAHLSTKREIIYNLAKKGFSNMEIGRVVKLPEANVRYHLREISKQDTDLNKILSFKHPVTGRIVGREHPLNTIIRGRMIELSLRNKTREQIEEIVSAMKFKLQQKKVPEKQIEEKVIEKRVELLEKNYTKAQIDDIIRKEIKTGQILLKHRADGKSIIKDGKTIPVLPKGSELKLIRQKMKDAALSRDTMVLHRKYIKHSNPELEKYLEVETPFPELKIYSGLCGQITKGLTFVNVPFMGLTTVEIGNALGISKTQVSQYLDVIRPQIYMIDDYVGLKGKIIKGIYFGKQPFRGLQPGKISDALREAGVFHYEITTVIRTINELEKGHFPNIKEDLKAG